MGIEIVWPQHKRFLVMKAICVISVLQFGILLADLKWYRCQPLANNMHSFFISLFVAVFSLVSPICVIMKLGKSLFL